MTTQLEAPDAVSKHFNNSERNKGEEGENL
jgi:hypothetical protein